MISGHRQYVTLIEAYFALLNSIHDSCAPQSFPNTALLRPLLRERELVGGGTMSLVVSRSRNSDLESCLLPVSLPLDIDAASPKEVRGLVGVESRALLFGTGGSSIPEGR